MVPALKPVTKIKTACYRTWKLVSFDIEFQDGSPRQALFGQHPKGFVIFTAEGRSLVAS